MKPNGIDPYYRGLGLHLLILAGYSLLFIGLYYLYPLLVYSPSEEALHHSRLWISRGVLISMAIHFCGIFLFDRKWAIDAWLSYWREKDTARSLGLFRVFFMFVITVHTATYPLSKFLPRMALDASSRVPLPFMGWFVHAVPISPEIYTVAVILGIVLGTMATLGLFSRWSLFGYAVVAFYIFGVPNFFGKLNHNHIIMWIPFLLSLGPSGDAFSLDALIRRTRGIKIPLEPATKYAHPLRLIWMQFGIIYLFAGLWKLFAVGYDWCLTDNLVNLMRWEWVENYDTLPWLRVDKVPWLLKIGGLGVIYFELLFILLILRPKTRVLALIGGISFHHSNLYFLNIGFISLLRSYFSFVPWEKLSSFYRNLPNKWIKILGVILLTLFLEKGIMGFYIPFLTIPWIYFLIFPAHFRTLKFRLLRIWGKWKTKKIKKPQSSSSPYSSKWVFILGGGLLAINAVCGLLSIDSWPFSGYPSYVDYLPNTMESLRIEAKDEEGNSIPLYETAEKENFRKEDFMRIEPNIINLHHQSLERELDKELHHYVDLWAAYFPELKEASYIEIYLDTYPLEPELRDQRIGYEKIHEWQPE